MEGYRKYSPVVCEIVKFKDTLPIERTTILPSLLDFQGKDKNVKRIKPHMNKMVFYSIYIN
jgi:hypothetical protein